MTSSAADARRRFFGRGLLLAGAPWWAGAGRAQSATAWQGFADSPSVRAGSLLTLRIRDPLAVVGSARRETIRWVRLGWPADEVVAVDQALVWGEVLPDRAWEVGCRAWRVSYQVRVPSGLASGLYFAELGRGASYTRIPVVVRPAQPTPGVRVLVQVPVTTVQAYNAFGGKSLYDYNSSAGQRATQVSMMRPMSEPFARAFDRWHPTLVRWLGRQGIQADFCTSVDLHQDLGLLRPYQLLLTAGHDEYWTRRMRDQVDAFVALGGNLVVLSGDTCSYQMRFEGAADDLRIVCHKSVVADPGGTPDTKTAEWHLLATPHPQASSFGLCFEEGATWTTGLPRPDTPYQVQQPGHWVFAGTGLGEGSRFGSGLIGYETDGAQARLAADGRLHPTGRFGVPGVLRILAQADCRDWDARAKALGLRGEKPGVATMAVFSRGGGQGTVFHAGITDWAYGLQPELDGQGPTVVGTVTRNLLQRLSARHAEPADVRQWRWPGSAGLWRSWHTLGTEAPAGAGLQGAVFQAWPGPASGTVPLWQYRADDGAAGRRWTLGLAADAGRWGPAFRPEGVLCHIWPGARAGSLPLRRWRGVDAAGLAHWTWTVGPTSPGAGWADDGIAGHVPA